MRSFVQVAITGVLVCLLLCSPGSNQARMQCPNKLAIACAMVYAELGSVKIHLTRRAMRPDFSKYVSSF